MTGARPPAPRPRDESTGDPTGADAEWPALDVARLFRSRPDLPAFPLHVLPGAWRGWVVDAAAATGTTVDHVAQLLLAAVAGTAGAAIVARLGDTWDEPLILWQALVGGPASDPGPALAAVRRALAGVARAPELQGRGPAPLEDERPLADLLAEAARRPAGGLLWRETPGAWLAALAGPAGARLAGASAGPSSGRRQAPLPVAALLEAWAPLRSALGPGRPALSLVGRLEAARLAPALRGCDDGRAARLLCTWPAPPPYRSFLDRPSLDESAAVNALLRLARAAGTPQAPRTLALDGDAARLLDAHLGGLHAALAEAGDGAAADWLAGGRATVPRLALALALLDWLAHTPATAPPPAVIGGQAMGAAVALWEHFRVHSLAVLERAFPSDEALLRRRLLDWLAARRPAEVSREDVRREALGQAVDAAAAQATIDDLVEAGVLRPVEAERRPGRPAQRWRVHPALAPRRPAQTARTPPLPPPARPSGIAAAGVPP